MLHTFDVHPKNSFKTKKRRWYMALLAMGLTVMTAPELAAAEQGTTQNQ